MILLARQIILLNLVLFVNFVRTDQYRKNLWHRYNNDLQRKDRFSDMGIEN